jgi:predicted SAM-dependent methyltransferase
MLFLIKILPASFRNKYRSQWEPIRTEIQITLAKAKRIISRPALPETKELNLHLGCGSINHPEFVNIDGLPAPHIHYIRSLDNLSIFKDHSVDLIYSSHCLEHFSHKKTLQILTEWNRVLKRGGILRLAVPDFDVLMKVYQETGNDIKPILGVLMGGQDYKYNFHMAAFNGQSLRDLLIEAGFSDVKEWNPGSSPMTTFKDCSTEKILVGDTTYHLSLNLEAVKL